jgi:hypothetical protein
VGQRTGIELQITALRNDLASAQMRVALDANIHLAFRDKTGLLADPVGFAGARFSVR